MAVLIGSARSDERGKATGGKAGDQKSGKEVSTQSWYKHSQGWRTFRCKDPVKAKKMAAAMRWFCASPLIGYDQNQRNTLYSKLELVKWDYTRLTLMVETDCSALIRVCAACAGIFLPDFNTSSQAKTMLASGEFVELTGSKYNSDDDFLGEGDVQVTVTKGHTIMVLENGPKYEGGVQPDTIDADDMGKVVLKYGMKNEAVRIMQTYLSDVGYDLGPDGKDGDFGKDTLKALKAFQADSGLDDDGEYGELSHAALMAKIDALNDVPVVTPEPTGDLTVKDGSWNIRTGPGTAYPSAGYVHGGDKLTSVDLGNWIPVLIDGRVLFISKNALK